MMKVSSQILLPLILATLFSLAHSARILAVISINGKSHNDFMMSVLRPLAKAGHDVVLYTGHEYKNPPKNLTVNLIESLIPNAEDSMKIFKIMSEKNIKDKCFDTHFGIEWFQQMMSSDRIKWLISSKENFDLIITEAFALQEFNLVFGHIFKAPTIAISAFSATSLINQNIGNSLSITSVPLLCSVRTFNMSFVDRFLNAYYLLRRNYIYYNHHMPSLEREMRRHFSDMPPLSELIQNVSLVFVNDHPTAAYAQPRTPNLIPVAGINLQPAKPLPQVIQKFMDEAQNGVILFCLGTFLPEPESLSEYFEMLKAVFARLKQRVLWKTRHVMEGVPPNVLTAEWLPQPDILAHKNCVLFITHGGLNSQIETIHHGVPVIAIPYMGDQPSNAVYYVTKGVGLMLDPSELSRESLSTAISTVLQDPSYARRMKSLSAMFRDRPMSAEQTVVYWTEYVLRHGGAPHLRPPPQPFYLRALLDLAAALVAVITAIAIFAYLTFYRVKVFFGKPVHKKADKFN